MEIEVTTTELEMLSSGEFKPKILDRSDVLVKKVEIPTPVINHFFFVNVGRPWKWYSRLKWTLADWKALVEKETTPFVFKVPVEPREIALNENGGMLAHDVLVNRDF